MENEVEIWRDVVGYEDRFKVSNFGNVWSKTRNKPIKLINSKTGGYPSFATRIGGRDGKAKFFKVHRLVAEAFLEPPSQEIVEECSKHKYGVVLVNHKDCNKMNNHVSNLEWCTPKQNSQHAVLNGLQPVNPRYGLDNVQFRLTEEQVQYIKDNYVKGSREFGSLGLAKKLGVGRGSIRTAIEVYIEQ